MIVFSCVMTGLVRPSVGNGVCECSWMTSTESWFFGNIVVLGCDLLDLAGRTMEERKRMINERTEVIAEEAA